MYIKKIFYPDKKKWNFFFKRSTENIYKIKNIVESILKKIKISGDLALNYYTKKLDKIDLKKKIKITEKELVFSKNYVSNNFKKAIQKAYDNIYLFHYNQICEKYKILDILPGIKCWKRLIPIEKVGFYIPSGSAPLFSSVLMLGIPAKLVNCKKIIICTPPNKNGSIHPYILYTANKIGIKNIYKVGGAQAIAAMAFGTETIPSVYKIFGPGNSYVTMAKQIISQNKGISIDMPAGPSEVAILADTTANPKYIAADLLSQAEHSIDSNVLLVNNSKNWTKKVEKELKNQLYRIPRKDIAIKSLKKSKIIILSNLELGIEFINEYSPEHLIINCENSIKWAKLVKNAGSVFIGKFSPESAGDYASGTNHILPTNTYARCFSGLSVEDFVKKITFQKLNKIGLKNISKTIKTLARAEGLIAHERAVTIRL